MKLAIDVREACKEKRTGKGQWTYGLVSQLLQEGFSLHLYSDRPCPTEWNCPVNIVPSGMRWHLTVAKMVQKSDVDFYISPTSYLVPFLIGKKFPTAVVVHDLIAFHSEPHDRKATLIERMTLGRAVSSASKVLCISTATKDDLMKQYPSMDAKNIHVIYAGPIEVHPPKNTPDGKTILCAATLCPRKNQLRLIDAFEELPVDVRSNHQLLLIGGRGWNDTEIVEKAKATQNVTWLGHVSEQQYIKHLQHCTVLALPSLYEGFGMQVLDALQRGIPVLTSNRGSLQEVAGDAALTVDPEDTEAIAQGLKAILTDAGLQADLAAKGPRQAAQFSWTNTVDLLTKALQDA